MDRLIERIELEAGLPGLLRGLVEKLTPTDLQSLLLEVYRLRAERRRPASLLSEFESDRFVRPSAVDPRELLRWERIAFDRLPDGFEPVGLSPVAPLGTSSVVAPVSQNWTVSTARNTEVVSDSSNVLALACALRRRQLLHFDPKSHEPVHLAASHRLLRAQLYDDPNCVPHFAAFTLCSAGRDRGDRRFEQSALRSHLEFYLAALRAFVGPETRLRISVSDFGEGWRADVLDAELLAPIRERSSGVECRLDPERTSGRGYYVDLCVKVHATAPDGRWIELIDGGSVDWTQKLLSSAKERLVISGLGSERLCGEFGTRRDAESEGGRPAREEDRDEGSQDRGGSSAAST